jgi:hypothetical protein
MNAPLGLTSTAPSVLVRPVIFRLREEGGDVTAEGLRVYERPATVTGVTQDSTRAPLPGVKVRLAGTPYAAVSSDDGVFRIDSLPPGTFDVVAEHPAYEALGMPAATGDVSLKEGDTKRITLRAAGTRDIVGRLCLARRPEPERATLRVNVRNQATGGPLAFATLVVTWREFGKTENQLSASTRELSGGSDSRGGVAFCDLPANTHLTLSRRSEADRLVPLDTLRLRAGEVATREARVPAPRP